MTDWLNAAIIEIAEETSHYTKPEAFTTWCDKIGSRRGLNGNNVYTRMKKRFKRMQYLPYLDNLQKVQLLFVFNLKVTPSFEKLLQKEGHNIELSDTQRILSFRSKDGKYRRSGSVKTKHFQGKPCQRSQDRHGQSPSDQDPQNDGASSSAADSSHEDSTVANDSVSPQDFPTDGPSSSGAYRSPDDDTTTEQKPIVFGGPGTPNFPAFVYNTVKEESMGDFENEQNGGRAPSSSRDVLQDRYRVPFDSPLPSSSEDLHNQRGRNDPASASVQKEILLNPQQIQMAEKNIPDNYSHGLIEQQRRNIKEPFSDQQISAEVYEESEGPRIPAVSPARNETSSIKRRQETELTQVKRPKLSRDFTENRGSTRRSISSSSEDDIIIIEPQFASFSTTPSSKSAPDSTVGEVSLDQEPAPMSALQLAEQIETIAHFLNLKDLQAKTTRIVQELQIENKTICPKRFHREILSVWASVDDAKVKNHVGESLNAKRFLESLRLCVIRPLGRKLVADSLVYIEKKIKKLEDKKSQKVLPMVKIQENLESLLELAADN